MAIGQYTEIPFKQAIGRNSYSQGEVIYQFDEPGFDFGRVVVRSNQANSLVRKDLFVGFTGNGLTIDARKMGGSGGRSAGLAELEIWLRIQGNLRSEKSYEWDADFSTEGGSGVAQRNGGVPAVIPFVWADGDPIGVEVTIAQPEQSRDTDEIRRMLEPHGIVTLPHFNRQTGGAWVVLKPQSFGRVFVVKRFSLREVESPEVIRGQRDLPIPVRYVPIKDVLENQIISAIVRGTTALINGRNTPDYWEADSPEENVSLTSLVVWALAENGASGDIFNPAMNWLARQEPDSGQYWKTETIAYRLRVLARHGGIKKYNRVIHTDIFKLSEAQFDDGGWTEEGRPEIHRSSAAVHPNNIYSALAVSSLREARLAGAEVENRLWRKAMKYWTNAQAFDGGYREILERYGGVGKPTASVYTAMGAASLIGSLDMASGIGSRFCEQYLGSKKQLRSIQRSLNWLQNNYHDDLRERVTSTLDLDPFTEPLAFQWLGESSGLSTFNNAKHFTESARTLLRHYDESTGMFGLLSDDQSWSEQPNVGRTALALSILGSGAAPTIGQRIVAGDDKQGYRQFRGDITHLVRYLSEKFGRPFNWLRTDIDTEVQELVKVPFLLITVVGPFDWTESQWQTIREYCLAGGSVVIDVPDQKPALREKVVFALRRLFPEYELRTLPADSPMFVLETRITSPPQVQALGNGFRDFLFIPRQSWSCVWHTYDTSNEDGFAFIHNLISYATDGTPPRSTFARSTYPVGTIPSRSMYATHLEIGGRLPAYPNLIDVMDRLMQDNYHFGVKDISDPDQADLLWVSVTGDAIPSESTIQQIGSALRNGRFVFMDVVSGREDWDESWRAVLRRLDGVTLTKLRRNDPIYTGEIPGTQGFDVVNVNLRKSLHTRAAQAGRCDLYSLRYHDKPAGVYSSYDIASGLGYHYFPDCRGVMPEQARQLAMNVCLTAFEWSLRQESDK